jgi:hypothetical protein
VRAIVTPCIELRHKETGRRSQSREQPQETARRA